MLLAQRLRVRFTTLPFFFKFDVAMINGQQGLRNEGFIVVRTLPALVRAVLQKNVKDGYSQLG